MPGEQRSRTSAFLFSDEYDDTPRGDADQMFVVMRTGATEAEVIGVKGLILAEGLTPFENAGTSRTRDRRRRRDRASGATQLEARLEAHARRRAGHPDLEARTSSCRASSTPRTRSIRVLDAVDRRRVADGHGRAVLGREPRPADGDRRLRRRRTARRSSAAARSSRAPARTASRAWASRASATSPRRASGPACRSSPRSWSPRQVDIVAEYADILQIGTRNMQNFSLLLACGRVEPAR